MKLEENERIVAVVPETCQGPGWYNRVIWVYIAKNGEDLPSRLEAIQGEDQTMAMIVLFKILEVAHKEMRVEIMTQGFRKP